MIKYVNLCIVIVLTLCISISGCIAQKVTWPRRNERIDRLDHDDKSYWQMARFKRLKVGELMDLLELKAGMTVLDIGAGLGMYSFEIAQRINGTGKVFSTEIDAKLVEGLIREVQDRGLKNVYPVLVRKEGLDPFYGKQRYDLILVIHVFNHMKDRTEFFKGLREYLNDDGRIVIMVPGSGGYFLRKEEIADYQGLISKLYKEPKESPYYRYRGIWDYNKINRFNKRGIEIADELKLNIVRELNILAFKKELLEYYLDRDQFKDRVKFTDKEKDFAQYLLDMIIYADILNRSFSELADKEKHALVKLNKLLIIQEFREFILNGENYFFTQDIATRIEKRKTRIMARAGYKLYASSDSVGLMEKVYIFVKD